MRYAEYIEIHDDSIYSISIWDIDYQSAYW